MFECVLVLHALSAVCVWVCVFVTYI